VDEIEMGVIRTGSALPPEFMEQYERIVEKLDKIVIKN